MNDKHNTPVFLLGLFLGSLSISRSLGKRGIKVYGYDFDLTAIGTKTKYCTTLKWNIDRNNDKEILLKLAQFSISIGQKCVLFPLNDEWVLFVSKYKKLLEKYYYFVLPDNATLIKVISKVNLALFSDECECCNFPASYVLDENNYINTSKDINYPCLLKFEYQNDWKGKLKSNEYYKVKIIKKRVNFLKNYESLNIYGNLIAQEIVQGQTNNLFYLFAYCPRNNEKPYIFVGNKLRTWPIRYGGETFYKSVVNKTIEEIGQKLIYKLKYQGPIGIDFKLDESDKKYKIIEINARFGTSDGLAIDSGIDFPYIYYLDSIGKSLKNMNHKYAENRIWINFTKDFEAYRLYQKKGSITFRDWLYSIINGKNMICSTYNPDDLKPVIYDVVNSIKNYFKRKFNYK